MPLQTDGPCRGTADGVDKAGLQTGQHVGERQLNGRDPERLHSPATDLIPLRHPHLLLLHLIHPGQRHL